ncbi:MAG TPA: hypothetical protein VIW64_09510 [Pyrinomonadaceae bacterium]
MLIHSLVIGFIDDFAALKNVSHKTVTHREPPGYLLWGADDQIERDVCVDSTSDLYSLSIGSALERHYDEKIDIGIPRRFAVGVGTEEYDSLRLKRASDLV